MRKINCCSTPLLMLLLLFNLPGFSQNQMTLNGRDGSNFSQFERLVSGRPVLEFGAEIQGTVFYSNDWIPGVVLFKDGKVAKGLPLRFNIYNNKVFFLRDEKQLEFTEPVSAFRLGMDSATAPLFSNGYTPVDKNDAETYYEVLANGKVQLLKYRQKLIREYQQLSQPKEKRFEDIEALYVFLPNYRIEKIKKNKNDILKLLPEYADAINKILDSQKLNCKNEEDLVSLFRELNKQ